MVRRSHLLRLVVTVGVVALLVAPLAATAGHGPGKDREGDRSELGHGKGRSKVTICHKGRTVTVALPALKGHLRHGDAIGRCGQAPVPGTATLTVVKHVLNNSGGTKTASDFTFTINGVSAQGGNTFTGSEAGVTKTITTFGAYSVSESAVPGYVGSMSAGCAGTISAGDQKVCFVTNGDVPATLTVVKHVINDHGGTKTAGNFTLTINGVTAIGGNTFAGSEAGVTKTLASVGSYSVTEVAVPGYVVSKSADCSGTIALGEHKTCTVTNDDV